MGNQSSGTAGAGGGGVTGGSDVFKQYAVDAHPVDVAEDYGGFSLLRGRRKRDNLPVLVMRCEKAKTTSAGLCSNALRQAKRLRHPLVLNLLDGTETDTDVFMVLEDATPLAVVLKQQPMSSAQRCWGARCLATALAFVNEKLRLVHGNVTPYTVFVTPGGDWKLFGLELVDMDCAASATSEQQSSNLPPLLRQAQWIPAAQYKPPERKRNEWTQMSTAPSWAMDSYALAVLLLETYTTKSSLNANDPARDVDSRVTDSPALRTALKQLLLPDARSRLSPSGLLRSEYFADMFVKCSVFLEELQLKAPEKKELFFASFAQSCAAFPPGALQHKMIPLVAQAISFESKAVNDKNVAAASGQAPPSPASVTVLLGMLDAVLVCDETVRKAVTTGAGAQSSYSSPHVDQAIVDLFACNDRVVRVGLLERIARISKASFSDASLNACFDQIATGFGDSTPKIRELTIKAMMPLAGKLNDQNRNDKLLRHIARLQTDAVPELRANSTVLLTAIAPLLSQDARRKTLTASYSRALKDAYMPARASGLRGLVGTHKLMGLDSGTLASKILPTICPMLVDPSAEVRTLAFDAMNALLKTLHEDVRAAEAKASSAAAGGGQHQQGGGDAAAASGGVMGMAGMAVNFFASAASSAMSTAPSAAAAAPPQQYVPPPVTAVSKPPKHIGGNWEDDDETDLVGSSTSRGGGGGGTGFDEEDPDDFFAKPPPPQQYAAPSAAAAAARREAVFDAFANEPHFGKPTPPAAPPTASASSSYDTEFAQPLPSFSSSRGGAATTSGVMRIETKKKVSAAADLDLFNFDAPVRTTTTATATAPPAPSAAPATRTVRKAKPAPAPAATADDDFFNSLLTTPAKRKG